MTVSKLTNELLIMASRCKSMSWCPSATARSTAGGTQGRLDLEHDPQIHITEERSRRTPNYSKACPQPEYGELHFSLSKWARCLYVMVSAYPIPTDLENTSGLIQVTILM